MRTPRTLVVVCAILATIGVALGSERLPLADRIRGYAAIERIRLDHRLDGGTGRASSFSYDRIDELIREDRLLEQLLREKWASAISQEDLNAEWQRIVYETWMPGRLEEIVDALGRDALMIQECLVLPTLVRRLARSCYLSDRLEQAKVWGRSTELAMTACSAAGTSAVGSSADVTVVLDPQIETEHDFREFTLRRASALHTELAASAPTCESGRSTLEERGPWVFIRTTTLLPGDIESTERLAVVPKIPWSVWRHGGSFPPLAGDSRSPEAEVGPLIAVDEVLRIEGVPERRRFAPEAGVPDLARESGLVLWTGSELVALGGSRQGAPAPPGIFDPITASWMPVSTSGPGFLATPLTGWWDGERVIVPEPGGERGWAYSLDFDAWTPLTTVPERPSGVPEESEDAPAVDLKAALARFRVTQDEAPQLLAPPAAQMVYADSQPMQFEWSGPSGAQYRVEWSSEMSFRKVIRSTPAWVTSSTLTPASKVWSKVRSLGTSTGSIYWRVQARAAGNALSYSDARSLHLAVAQAPVILSPPYGRLFLTDEQPAEVRWDSNHNSTFQVVVSPTPDLAGAGRIVLGKGYKLKGESVRLSARDWAKTMLLADKAGDGIVYIGVQARDRLGRVAPTSVILVRVVAPEDGNWRLGAEADPEVLALEPGVAGSATVYVYAEDSNGDPVSGLPVWVTSSSGTLGSGAGPIITDGDGWAEDTLTTASTALVDFRSGRAHAVARVDVVLPEWQVDVGSFPQAIYLPDSTRDGSARVIARVLDQFGAPVVGAAVRFATTSGRMDSGGAERITNGAGKAEDIVRTRDPATVSASTRWGSGSTEVGIDRVNLPPTAVIVTTPAAAAHPRESVSFSGAGSRDSDGTIVEYRWRIESSKPDSGRPNPKIVISPSPVLVRVYENIQSLGVRLTTVDDQGSTGEASISYSIDENLPPTVDAGPPQVGIVYPSPYQCTITLCPVASDPDGQVTALQFSWGDSDSPVLPVGCQNHTYRRPSPTLADYKVVVVAYDNGDRQGACLAPPPAGGFDSCTSRKTAIDSTVVTCSSTAVPLRTKGIPGS